MRPDRFQDVKVTPDLLTFTDGTTVGRNDWERRRAELAASVIPHEFGGLPPEGDGTTATLLSSYAVKPELRITYQTYEVRTAVGGGEVLLELRLWIPEGDGPFPVLLTGDGCWRFFTDQVVSEVVNRGNIAAVFNRAAAAADNPDHYRTTGLYRTLPDASFGALAAWAWAYHRCIDALVSLPLVCADRIAITGHSRGGKTTLLAGATDTRIALTNAHCSGTGGAGLNALKGSGAEVIEDFVKSRNIFWFGEEFRKFARRDADLPYDQHFLLALVAPRGLFVSEARGDIWANPPGSYAACLAAHDVFSTLGAGDQLGWSLRSGEHDHTLSDFRTLLDFMDSRFRDLPPARDFQPALHADLAGPS